MSNHTTETTEKSYNYEFFEVSPRKLCIMSLTTFGLYEVYWMYKNWKVIKDTESSDIWPICRAIFAIIFVYPLFKKMDMPDAGKLAVLYIVLSLMWHLPDPYWLISMFSFTFLAIVQADYNQRLKKAVVDVYAGRAVVAMIVGGSLLVLSIVDVFTRS